jgi:hypothetical protein
MSIIVEGRINGLPALIKPADKTFVDLPPHYHVIRNSKGEIDGAIDAKTGGIMELIYRPIPKDAAVTRFKDQRHPRLQG